MVTNQDYWTEFANTMVDKVIGNDEYQLLEELGHGSYGCLFLGQSLRDNTYVAVKILSKTGLDHHQLKLQQLEIDIQMSLKHAHLLALHRTIYDKDHIFMVMELCDQGDLFDFVLRDSSRDESFVRSAFAQILEGVEHMHAQNIYHRDIKLENILLKCDDDDERQEGIVCKVADFGLATRERYSLEFGCGSASYLAPEHFEDDTQPHHPPAPYDAAASDSWSLGILLLALLYGRNPWEEANLLDPAFAAYKRDPTILKQQLFPSLSPACDRFLRSALAIHAADRPSVKELCLQFASLDRLVVDDDEEDWSEDEERSPVDIPTTIRQNAKASFDSAIFSGEVPTGSWSDMVEEDEEDMHNALVDSGTLDSAAGCFTHDEDDTDMFIHNEEKESWWL